MLPRCLGPVLLATAASLAAQGPLSPAGEAARAALRPFRDDGLPRHLEQALTARGGSAARTLGRLGSAAHEAVFGTLRGSYDELPVHFADAFAALQPAADWAVPLLAELLATGSRNSPLCVQLLERFGDAAASAAPALRAALDSPYVQPPVKAGIERLLAGLPREAPKAKAKAKATEPTVDPALTAGLLEVLERGRPNQAWPALQALLRLDDAAVQEAALVLVVQAGKGSKADARRLLDVLRAVYRARVSPDPQIAFGAHLMRTPQRWAGLRRYLLADFEPRMPIDWEVELRQANAQGRRTLALAAALRSTRGGADPFTVWVLEHPEEIPPVTVRPMVTQPRVADPPPWATSRTISGARLVELLRDALSSDHRAQMSADQALRSASIDEFPAAALPLVLRALQEGRLQIWVGHHLHRAGPALIEPAGKIWDDIDDQRRRVVLLAIGRMVPLTEAALTFVLLRARETRTTTGMWANEALRTMNPRDVLPVAFELLKTKEWRGDVLAHLGELLPADAADFTEQILALLPELDERQASTAIGKLTYRPREGLEMLHDWIAHGAPGLRRAAVRAFAWRTNDPQWTATVLGLLRDPDPAVAEAAAQACAWAIEERERIVAALIELWPAAHENLQAVMVRAFARLCPEAAAAKGLLEPRLAAPGWGARLAAAQALLAQDAAHTGAGDALRALLGDADAYTRRAALNSLQQHPAAAEHLGPAIAQHLEDPDPQVVLEALYVCHAAPRIAVAWRERLSQLAASADFNMSDWAKRVGALVDALKQGARRYA